MHNKKENTCLLINITIPYDLHAHTKETKKTTNTWRSGQEEARTKILAVIIGASGTVKKVLDHNLQSLSDHSSVKEYTLGTAHIICKVLG
jgi:hypothetical protein